MVTVERYFPPSFIAQMQAKFPSEGSKLRPSAGGNPAAPHEAISHVETKGGCDIIFIRGWMRHG